MTIGVVVDQEVLSWALTRLQSSNPPLILRWGGRSMDSKEAIRILSDYCDNNQSNLGGREVYASLVCLYNTIRKKEKQIPA